MQKPRAQYFILIKNNYKKPPPAAKTLSVWLLQTQADTDIHTGLFWGLENWTILNDNTFNF